MKLTRAYRLRLTALLACLLPLACFDLTPPVEERLVLSFLADGGLRAQLKISLRHPEGKRASSNLGRRLRQLEEDLLAGFDPWTRRFDAADAAVESFYWEKEKGRLVYLERNLLLDDPADLSEVLADTPIQATYTVEDGIAELALFPGLPGKATRRERRELERELDTWSETLAAYFRAAEDFYHYLDLRPERALVCFGEFFESEEEYGEPTEEEELLLESLGDATTDIIDVLDVDADRAYSLDELSRKVFDPFPALFEVELPSPAIDAEGFKRAGERWAVPGLSLWSAFELLEGVWLTPDPVIAWVTHARIALDEPFDVATFAARERSAHAAEGLEVRDALIDALTPADVYRVAWRVGPAEEG